MTRIRNENFVGFADEKQKIEAEIFVDRVSELPETGDISGKILVQGSVALIIETGEIALLLGDGKWYIGNEVVE